MRNKFISHLADDVIQENHHLKDEVIKMRKKLKSRYDCEYRIRVTDAKIIDRCWSRARRG